MKTIRKFLSITAVLLLTLTMFGCSSASSSAAPSESSEETVLTIAIVKQLDHPSLDEIANAAAAKLDALAAEKKIVIHYEIYSGQNDPSTLQQIGEQLVSEEVDAIIPIATMAAQVMTNAAAEKKIPVIFGAVSDPEGADLTGIDYVSGTSDALNTNFIMDMILKEDPDTAKVGLLYSTSEINSEKPIAEAKAFLDSHNIPYVEATGTTADEVLTAASVLISEEVDAIFTPTDNVIMDSELALAPLFIAAGIKHYAGADSFVRNGAYATCGVNYTDLGAYSAQLAVTAATAGMEGLEDYYLMEGGIITVNTETAQALSADYSVFKDMGTLVEVITTEE
ncbi:MAG: hypothetical protein IKE21_02135 [Erysipelotrichaceae bacterium]|nr:hypothetical protein [Erysipelotrichaceae bacterium]